MQTFKIQTEEVRVVSEVVCNKCGQSCLKECGTTVAGEPSYDAYGLIGAKVIGGFPSKELADGQEYRFDVCEKCLVEFFVSFVIKPD